MADFGFILGDMGAGFTIISDDMDADIGYGEFALTLINTDFQTIVDCISYSLQNNHALQYGEDLERSGHFKDHVL